MLDLLLKNEKAAVEAARLTEKNGLIDTKKALFGLKTCSEKIAVKPISLAAICTAGFASERTFTGLGQERLKVLFSGLSYSILVDYGLQLWDEFSEDRSAAS
ncbi:hypothetical protein [Microbulbifer sp. THAF38]|uniref:hypothetical protein n=1 Tax=Microbulbifer sp. THAF38 TaxID=2587856 RepID=UPI0012681D68|nr:hypothetical protein [Microbulbifer sp. THAF38]QFT55995.1 hypothetical protein FIU95_15705 [Microbulbifer sp. THAF38]